MNKYSNGCTAHDIREVQLMNKIHGLEVRNTRLREALKAAIKALEMCGLYLEGPIPEKYEAVINQGFEKSVAALTGDG